MAFQQWMLLQNEQCAFFAILRSGEDGCQIARAHTVKTYKQFTCVNIIPHEDRCNDNTVIGSNSERHIDNLINNQRY